MAELTIRGDRLDEPLVQFLDARPPVLAAIHALVTDGIPVLRELAALLLRHPLDDAPFAAVWIVLLPRSDASALRRSLAADLTADALGRLTVQVLADAELDTLLALLADVPPRTAVIVAHADHIHALDADEPSSRADAPGMLGAPMGLHFREDVWVPGVCALVTALRARPWLAHAHVVLLVEQSPPIQDAHLDALDAHLDNYVLIRNSSHHGEAELVAWLSEWQALLVARGVDELRDRIAATTADPFQRAHFLARTFAMSGRWEEAHNALWPAAERLHVRPPPLLHFLACIALYTGRHDEAHAALIELVAAERLDESELRNAHKVALQAEDTAAQIAVLTRMRRDYPGSIYLVRAEAIERYLADDYTALLGLRARLQRDPELPSYALMFDRAEHRCGLISRAELLARAAIYPPKILDAERAALIDEAIARHDVVDAASLLLPPLARASALAGGRLLTALVLDDAAPDPLPAAVFDHVLRYVADHPEDIDVRAALARAIAVDQAGSAGLELMFDRLHTVERLPPLETVAPRLPGREVSPDETDAFMRFIHQQYLEAGSPHLMIAPTVLRSERTEAELRTLLLASGPVLRYAIGTITGPDTLAGPRLVVKAILDIWRTLGSRGADVSDTLPIEVFAGLAQGMATAGLFQEARDIADVVLTYGGSSALVEARRCAWIAHADLQLRSNHVEAAMLGILCAQAHILPTLQPSERYNELDLHIRLLRTLHQYDAALAYIPELRAALVGVVEPGWLTRKIDDLETGLRFLRLDLPVPANQRDELLALVAAAVRSTEFALAHNDELLVPSSWLAQLLHACVASDVAVPAAVAVFERTLAELPPSLRPQLRSLAGATVDIETLLRHACSAAQARAAEDLGAHMGLVRVDAHRLLDGPCSPEHALLALELLVDPTLECGPPERSREDQRIYAIDRRILRNFHFLTNGPGAVAEMHAVPEFLLRRHAVDADFPASNTWNDPARLHRFACELGSGDRELVALARHDDRLVRVEARDGALAGPAFEPATATDPHHWRTALHALFTSTSATDPTSVAATRNAMHGLGLETTAPEVVGRSVVYMLAHPLAGVPANLLLRNGELAGLQSPVAVVPSLSWLLERRRRPPRGHGRHAWILPSTDLTGPPSALALLADNLPRALPGFTTEVAFPAPPRPLEVAVLAAHGGTDAHDHYFSAIGDERAHHFSISRVAAALAGCELVVLFVCHGGRTAAAPFSTRSVGLPSALLGAGCRTVIAAPWPLDALVAVRWTVSFLAAWTLDTDVDVAVHHANLALARSHCHPRDFLAMHVFGDPALRPQA